MTSTSPASGPQIVVGVDGSEPSRQALTWALGYAGQVGGRVRAVRGWSISTAPRPATHKRGYAPSMEEYESAVLEELGAECRAVAAERADDVPLEHVARYGPAANALMETAADADLLVVGARGHGGFRGLTLGSVSDQCVRHSPVPVVVVRREHSADVERTRHLDAGMGGE